MLENFIHAAEHLAGFAIVVVALSLLWAATVLVGRYFQASAAKAAAAPPRPEVQATAASATPPARSDDGIPEDIIVAIATAVTFMLDQPHQIVSVRSSPSRWGVQGRSDIHASHRLR